MNSILLRLLPLLIGQISPIILKEIDLWIIDMQKKSKETENPFDDLLFDFLAQLRGL